MRAHECGKEILNKIQIGGEILRTRVLQKGGRYFQSYLLESYKEGMVRYFQSWLSTKVVSLALKAQNLVWSHGVDSPILHMQYSRRRILFRYY